MFCYRCFKVLVFGESHKGFPVFVDQSRRQCLMCDDQQSVARRCDDTQCRDITHARGDRHNLAFKAQVEATGAVGKIGQLGPIKQLSVAYVSCYFRTGLYLIRGCF